MNCFIQMVGKRGRRKFTIVDKEDFDNLIKYRWYISSGCYVAAKVNGQQLLMHRLIMNCPKNKIVDHKNHDTLDNRKENLRICTRTENIRNSIKRVKSSNSIYKGVWRYRNNSWGVLLQGKTIGCRKNEIDAAEHYDYFSIQRFGEFAYLNFPENDYSDFELKFNKKIKHSRFIGVSKNHNGWQAGCRVSRKNICLGTFKTEEEAAKVRDEFVKSNNLNRKLNFP